WGDNGSSQLGVGPGTDSPVSLFIEQDGEPGTLGIGDDTTCGLLNGTFGCWGAQFGAVPTSVGGFSDVQQLSVGGGHTCVVRAGGVLDCWGSNTRGQLGNGNCCIPNGTPTTP